MIESTHPHPTPAWLMALNDQLPDPIPIRDVLDGSLYYPSCALDGDPVRYLGGLVHSFVYVDYAVGRDAVLESLHDPRREFRGYHIIGWRDVTEHELAPEGWTPQCPGPEDGVAVTSERSPEAPFAVWTVLERDADHDAAHGPDRFSLLYIGGEGVATFQALYGGNDCAPLVVAIIQPGHGFGLNWTNFEDPNMIFARSVRGNRAGRPRYLLWGQWADTLPERCCWPEYDRELQRWQAHTTCLGLWESTAEIPQT